MATSVTIENLTTKGMVCPFALLADTFGLRLRGLLGRDERAVASGLLLCPSTGIHTFGMTLPIDVVALSADFMVLEVWEAVKPWSVRTGSRRMKSALELPSGQAKRCGISIGHQLAIHTL